MICPADSSPSGDAAPRHGVRARRGAAAKPSRWVRHCAALAIAFALSACDEDERHKPKVISVPYCPAPAPEPIVPVSGCPLGDEGGWVFDPSCDPVDDDGEPGSTPGDGSGGTDGNPGGLPPDGSLPTGDGSEMPREVSEVIDPTPWDGGSGGGQPLDCPWPGNGGCGGLDEGEIRATPEPATIILAGAGLAFAARMRRRARRGDRS
jgi:hypothetical protein